MTTLPAPRAVTVAPAHPVAQAAVRAVHKAVTPVLKAVTAPIRPYGLHPSAWLLFLKAGVSPKRIGQTIGHAAASAGTHVKTGVFQGHDYSPCFDLHVKDLTVAQILTQIVRPLAAQGFVVYLRVPGKDHWPPDEAFHVHVVYPGCAMTAQVAHQVEDWLNQPDTLNGLASHVKYGAYQATHEWRLACRPLFAQRVIVQS